MERMNDLFTPELQLLLTLVTLLLPLCSFAILFFFGRYMPGKGDMLATSVMALCTLLAMCLFFTIFGDRPLEVSFKWFSIGEVQFRVAILLNSVAAMMLLVVTLISFLVHLYSLEYMEGKMNYLRYFPYLALFTFAMLGLVLSDDLLITFMFWELVGFSSFLLIGFWFEKDSAQKAARKAFMYNRIGDAGFLIGILILYANFGTLNFTELSALSRVAQEQPEWLIVAGLCIFCGSIGKSAQFPLFGWLPDAMEGPTPVSALIHAATMVAAGVYLLFKVFMILTVPVLTVIAIIGTLTAFMGAFAAFTQYDIKKVLAYSTISQLGYMMIGMGTGAYDAALFHLLTHAFFKACLFLSAGAVIHGMHHLQKDLFDEGRFVNFNTLDMRLMGGFRKFMPVTFIAYVVATCSLIGLPLFSGFLSKDAILLSAWNWASVRSADGAPWYWLVPLTGFITVLMTAFYMGRQVFMVFFGSFRLGKAYPQTVGTRHHVHEAPLLMKMPLVLLAAMSFWLIYSVDPLDASSGWFFTTVHSPFAFLGHDLKVPLISVGLGVSGLVLAWFRYGKNADNISVSERPNAQASVARKLSWNNFYMDALFARLLIRPVFKFARASKNVDKVVVDGLVHAFGILQVVLANMVAWVDQAVVDGLVRLCVWLAGKVGKMVKGLQQGMLQYYLLIAAGVVIITLFITLL